MIFSTETNVFLDVNSPINTP